MTLEWLGGAALAVFVLGYLIGWLLTRVRWASRTMLNESECRRLLSEN